MPQDSNEWFDDQIIDTPEVAKRTKTSPGYWNKLRLTGDGPPFIKIGRSVRYLWGDVRRYIASRARRSTSEAA